MAHLVQADALKTGQWELLRQSVSEHGPQLCSNLEDWSNWAYWAADPERTKEQLQYLISEYPRPHIDTVLIHGFLGKPEHTNWLNMAIYANNLDATEQLLKAGADPSCPGLPFDAASSLWKHQRRHFPFWGGDRVRRGVNLVRILEKRHSELPSYAEHMSHISTEVERQRDVWNARVRGLIESRCEIPFQSSSSRSPEYQEAIISNSPSSMAAKKKVTEHSFTYQPLRDKTSFRLLELLPASDMDAPLVGRLANSDISSGQLRYEALSYVWGEPVADGHIVLGDDGDRLPLTANLRSALTHLRPESSNGGGGQSRIIWVDAICINQTNIAERNQQVPLMGAIYKKSHQVIIWLGKPADDSHLVFEYIRDRRDKIRRQDPATRDPPPESYTRARRALLSREWFFRTSVIQEAALNPFSTLVICGRDSARWVEGEEWDGCDVSGASRIWTTMNPLTQATHPLSGFDPERHATNLAMATPGSDPVGLLQYSLICRSSDVRDRIYGILGLLFEPGLPPPVVVDYGLPAGEVFRQFTEAVIRSTGNLGILQFLGGGGGGDDDSDAAGSLSSPRSPPSLLGPDNRRLLASWVPDFGGSSQMTSTTTRRPEGARARALPRVYSDFFGSSWPPDFPDTLTLRRAATANDDGTQVFQMATEDFPDKILPGLKFNNNTGSSTNTDDGGESITTAAAELIVHGKIVDKIKALGPELPITDDNTYAPGTTAGFFEVMRAWEMLATTLLLPLPEGEILPAFRRRGGSSLTQAFAATLLACDPWSGGRGDGYGRDPDMGFVMWYRYCGTGVLERADPSMMLRDHEFYLWWLYKSSTTTAFEEEEEEEEKRKKEEEEDDDDDVEMLDVGSPSPSSLFHETDQERDERTRRDLDKELETFAYNMEPRCYGRRFFVTEKGTMGLAGPRARVGDSIAFIPGGDPTFALRRRRGGDGKKRWYMAGHCFLYGLDPFEVFESDDNGECVVEEFVIR